MKHQGLSSPSSTLSPERRGLALTLGARALPPGSVPDAGAGEEASPGVSASRQQETPLWGTAKTGFQLQKLDVAIVLWPGQEAPLCSAEAPLHGEVGLRARAELAVRTAGSGADSQPPPPPWVNRTGPLWLVRVCAS